ncbi:MAG: S9 family peptidase [Thermoanaerobaculia bacterium]
MNRKLVASAVLLFLPAVPAAWAADPPAANLAVPESIDASGVPPIPRAVTETLLPYENLRVANFMDWHPTERRMLIQTRFGESPQIHEVTMPMGARTQVTFYSDPTDDGQYRPGAPDQLIYSLNEGGAENFQLFLLDRRTGKARRLTDGVHRHVSPTWSRDGKLLAYAGNARNGRDMDIYVIDPAAAGGEKRIAEVQGSFWPLEWSPDNRRILLYEYISANEAYLHWIDAAGGPVHAVTPRDAGKQAPAVQRQGGHWSADGKSVYTLSDRDSEFLRLVRIDVASGKPTVLSGDLPWDVEDFDLSDDGRLLAFFSNEDGISKLHFLDAASGKPLAAPDLPAGVAAGLRFRPGSREVGFAVSWARSPSDIYSYDPDRRKLERWTESEAGGLSLQSLPTPDLVHFPTFDAAPGGARRMIPAFVYHPAPDRFPGKRPVYISIHGGPEGQSRPLFLGSINLFPNELGVAIVYPNVRGSTGYGKTYLKMDNGRLREDSVKDIGALLDWIATQPDLDASRVMVAGGSYGGYMTLASMVHYSDRLCCGWDSVGISNFVTFLEHTQGYRQDLRRAEYGDEREPGMREFLQGIAPANQAKKITKPLLVSQGANDPRVPLAESDQIVKAVRDNGQQVWYLVAKDEGHGFGKKSNTDYQRAVLYEFARRFLLGEK